MTKKINFTISRENKKEKVLLEKIIGKPYSKNVLWNEKLAHKDIFRYIFLQSNKIFLMVPVPFLTFSVQKNVVILIFYTKIFYRGFKKKHFHIDLPSS